jgi:hypothetical protein
MWDFVMDRSGAGAGFLRELRFPLPIYIPSASPQSSFTITRGWHNRPGVVAVPIASQTKLKKKEDIFGRTMAQTFFFKLAGRDFGYCGHYWPIIPAPDDR